MFNLLFRPEELTEATLQRTAAEIAEAKTRARSAWDWSLIRDCEKTLSSARLQAARLTVAHLDRGWNPQRKS